MPDELVKDVDKQEEVSIREIPFSEIMDDIQQGFMLNGYSNYRLENNQLNTPFGKIGNSIVKELKDYRFEVIRTAIPMIPNEFNPNVFYNLVITKPMKGQKSLSMVIIEYALDTESYNADFEFSKYTGYIRTYSLNGEIVNEIRMIDGKQASIANARTESVCGYEYELRSATICPGPNEDYCNTEYYWEAIPIDCAGNPELDGGGEGGVSGGGTPVNPPRIRELILTPSFTSNQKAMCIWSKINDNGFFTSMMQFFVGSTEFDIEVAIVPSLPPSAAGTPRNGLATWRGPNLPILIEFSNTYLTTNASIRVARTFLHEIIHAEIFRYQNTSLPIGTEITEMLSLGTHHEMMSINYVNQLAGALNSIHHNFDYQLFANYLNDPSGLVPIEFYKALAWEGLKATQAYQNLSQGDKDQFNAWQSDAQQLLTSTCQ